MAAYKVFFILAFTWPYSTKWQGLRPLEDLLLVYKYPFICIYLNELLL